MTGKRDGFRLIGRCVSIAGAIALAVLLLMPQIACAQNYPNRPVRLILPFGPGGVADVTARMVTEKLGEKLGQRFIIENMPGAGGITAARAVLSSPPDGYTLALLSNGTAISVSLFKNLRFNPVTDFVPVSSMGYFDFILVTRAGSPYRTLADLIKAAREKPGALNVGTINVGSTQNLSAQLFKSTAGVEITIVPFRSSPDVLIALLRGDIQMTIENYTAVQSHISDKAVTAVSTSGSVRTPFLPDVPTVKEAGGGDFEARSWNAIFAPKGTPPEVIRTLNAALRDVLDAPDLKKRALELGIEAKASTPEEIAQRLKDDIEKWAKVIERAGIEKQ
ncbi:tripartite tricarboxylate transporter substrate binding protein [Bradyrhizobium sp. AUGA SZCCT0169]|uniref:Bug family tripartite tricarboxylate transporter substrate binding protein n=1 Tax=Bradyrhizobium sp. AUGA SZCCT0169 TaxID=2807663 RepID=UPI001BAD6F68|nr:tripartite tricarboxylate transporter substrate binding protein [Bradyrhizobium sp. AUGA SZCCT0169]MBR1250940.1 tripartite tricarboxylate transporter substrate binding protein [Bradyrhizobium sp. AUGA SZCCT0169]